MNDRGRMPGLLLGISLLGVILLAPWLVGCTSEQPEPIRMAQPSDGHDGYHGSVPPEPWPLPSVTLVDGNASSYNLAQTPTRPVTVVFFGYTHCPDTCPAVLSGLAMALRRVDHEVRDQVQVLVITTDPARDTPAVLRTYLARFDPGFVGLTGEPGQISAAAGGLGIALDGRRTLPGGGYDVSHSAQLIGFGKDGRAAVRWEPETSAAALGQDLTLLAARQR